MIYIGEKQGSVLIKQISGPGLMTQAFNPSTGKAKAGKSL